MTTNTILVIAIHGRNRLDGKLRMTANTILVIAMHGLNRLDRHDGTSGFRFLTVWKKGKYNLVYYTVSHYF